MSKKLFSPACERNKDSILQQLTVCINAGDHILEVGSGSGQHGEFFAATLPNIVWQWQ